MQDRRQPPFGSRHGDPTKEETPVCCALIVEEVETPPGGTRVLYSLHMRAWIATRCPYSGRYSWRCRRKAVRSAGSSMCIESACHNPSIDEVSRAARRTSTRAIGPTYWVSARCARSSSGSWKEPMLPCEGSSSIAGGRVRRSGATSRRKLSRSVPSGTAAASSAHNASSPGARPAAERTMTRAIGPR